MKAQERARAAPAGAATRRAVSQPGWPINRLARSSTTQVAVASRQSRARSATASQSMRCARANDRKVHQAAKRRLAELLTTT
jgi:hypothetical protein